MRTVVYLNPFAGGGRSRQLHVRLAGSMRRHQVEVLCPEDATRAIATLDTAIAKRPNRLIAIGGDGTANLVASRILAQGAGREIIFGLVPAGTGSDLAAALGLANDPEVAFANALTLPPRPLDAIELTRPGQPRRFAINIASIGISGAVAQIANATIRKSRITYLHATLRALRHKPAPPWRLTLDGHPIYDGRFFVAAFANGPRFGGGMRVAPNALLDDGLADVVVVPPVPLWTLPVRLPQFLTGRHINLPFVRVARGRRLDAAPKPGHPPSSPIELDGETATAGPARFQVLEHALKAAAKT